MRCWMLSVLFGCCFAASSLSAQEVAAPPGVTVLTYNIHHGEGTDGKLDLERIAKVIRDSGADLVALQEVDRDVGRSGRVDQPAKLAELAGYPHWTFGESIPLAEGKYGNAILSKWKFEGGSPEENSVVKLPIVNAQGAEQRTALFAHVVIPGSESPLAFAATHFDHRRPHEDRLAAVEAIGGEVSQRKSGTMILAGDLNCPPDSPPAQLLKKMWNVAHSPELLTFPAGKPRTQIDYVAIRPAARWKLTSAKVLEEPQASDHRPLLVTYQFLP